ncbi:MAG: hypothetical protein Q9164_001412 [Protoblastenia rupestris]
MSQKRARSPSPVTLKAYKSSPVDDRSSRFIAAYSPQLSAKELQDLPDFASATHRITAWRRPSAQRSLSSQPLLQVGHNDDGEKYGGKTLEKVLANMNVEGSIVVARWYGGVMLGPIRFDHIKNCAIEAISKWRIETDIVNKRSKTEANDREERARLIKELPERDRSIFVLRGLLAEKKETPKPEQGDKDDLPTTPEYGTLPLTSLRRMDRARDATIGWILQQLKTAEESQRKRNGSPENIEDAV